MPKNKDFGQRVSDTFETRWAENARVTQLLKDKLSLSLDNVSMVGNKLKIIKITIPAKHYYYSVSHNRPRKNHETDEYLLFDDKEEIMSCTDDSYVDKFSNYILNKINEELEMNSIYEQMNKIDDNESLNEKYNVRTLKDVKKLQESTDYSDAWKAAYRKLNRAAQDAELVMDDGFVEYALEDDGAHVDDVIENEVTYIGDVLKKKFPDIAFWHFLQDERFSSAIQVYVRPKNSRRFSDVRFVGNYEVVHGNLHPIDLTESRNKKNDVKKLKKAEAPITESVDDYFNIDKYYIRGNDEDAIRSMDDPDLAEYLIKCEEVDPGCKHVCWLIARDAYLDALDEFALVELVDCGDEVGEFPAIFVRDRVYNITEEIMHMLGIDD